MKTTSSQITVLDFGVLVDLSAPQPKITVSPQSTVVEATGLRWAIQITSPGGTPIKSGDLQSPDYAGAWSTELEQTTGFPRPFNQVEWGTYLVKVSVQDAAGAVFALEKSLSVVRPVGNDATTGNTYGRASATVQVRCQQAQAFVEDTTNYSWGGVQPTPSEKKLVVSYPVDETGVAPDPRTYNNFSSALVDLTQNGPGYGYTLIAVQDYELGDSRKVRLRYVGVGTFAVHCNLDLTPLGCKIKELIDELEGGTCPDRTEAEGKLRLITPKFQLALTGILYPQTCVDPWALVEEIKKIGGWDCNCASGSFSRLATATAGSMQWVLSTLGDVSGSWEVVGSTITLQLKDFSYVFRMAEAAGSAAYTITPATTGQVKTYALSVNTATLADEVLTAVKNSTALLNKFNELVKVNAAEAKVTVEGKCIIEGTAAACDYLFKTVVLPDPSAMIQVTTLVENSGDVYISHAVNYWVTPNVPAELAALATRLALGGKGVFTVALVGGALQVTTLQNPRQYIRFNYKLPDGTMKEANVERSNCSGSVEKTNLEILQALINWACGLIAAQVKTGAPYEIKKLVTLAGDIQKSALPSDALASTLFDTLIAGYNSLVEVVKGMKEVSCDNLKTTFSTVATALTDDALLYGYSGGCTGIPLDVLARKLFVLAQNSEGVKTEFCKAASACVKATAAPVTNATLAFNGTSTLTLTITNVGALKYRVGYRPYGTQEALLGVEEMPQESGATTQKVWTPVAAKRWEAVVVAIYQGGESAPYTAVAPPCAPLEAFAASYDASTGKVSISNVGSIAPGEELSVKFSIYYPGGVVYSYSRVFLNEDDWADQFPEDPYPWPSYSLWNQTYGEYTITAQRKCSTDGKFLSDPLSVKFTIEEPVSCPPVTDIRVTNITTVSAVITAKVPQTGNAPQNYTLRLTSKAGNHTFERTAAASGDTITWSLQPGSLNADATYYYEVRSNCVDSAGNWVAGGSFTLYPSGVYTAGLTLSNGSSSASGSVTVLVNGTVIHANTGMASGLSTTFDLAGYTGAELKLVVCNTTATTSSLVLGGVTYPPDSNTGTSAQKTFVYNAKDLPANQPITLTFG